MDAREPITVELVGPEMEVKSADPLVVLAFATAYFEALEHVARKTLGRGVGLRGLQILDKCIGAQSNGWQEVVVPAVRSLHKSLNDPFERDEKVRALGREFHNLPADVEATVIVRSTQRFTITAVEPFREKLSETVDFQAYVHRTGGTPPAVELIDRTDLSKVFLRGSEEDIRALSKHLFTIVEVYAEVLTDQVTGRRAGKLISYETIPATDPIEAWRKWFAENAPEWSDIEDVEAELEGSGLDQ